MISLIVHLERPDSITSVPWADIVSIELEGDGADRVTTVLYLPAGVGVMVTVDVDNDGEKLIEAWHEYQREIFYAQFPEALK